MTEYQIYTTCLGGDPEDAFWAAIEGYIIGFGLGMVLCMALACSVATFAITLGVISSVSGALSSVMLIWAVTQKNERAVIVYGALVVLSIIGCCEAYNTMQSVYISGDDGFASFLCNRGKIDDVIVRGVDDTSGSLGDVENNTTINGAINNGQPLNNHRIVSNTEVSSLPATG